MARDGASRGGGGATSQRAWPSRGRDPPRRDEGLLLPGRSVAPPWRERRPRYYFVPPLSPWSTIMWNLANSVCPSVYMTSVSTR